MYRWTLLAVSAGLVLAAAGCTGSRMILGGPPRAAPPDTFAYRPIECRPSGRVFARVPAEPPRRAEARPPAPALPDHEAAWDASAEARPWRWIVIHHSGSTRGSASSFDAWHRNGRHWDELGYHFVIGNGTGSGDGQVEVGSRWPKQKHGAHCRVGDNEEYNYFGIGICLVGNFDRERPSEAQAAALCRLVDYLAARYRIDDAHIIGHGMVGDTRCPGRCFSLDAFLARLRAARSARQGLASAL